MRGERRRQRRQRGFHPLRRVRRVGVFFDRLAETRLARLADQFGFVRLRGELSGVKRAASGHLYMSLKDEGAVLDGVMWKGQAARLAGINPADIAVLLVALERRREPAERLETGD